MWSLCISEHQRPLSSGSWRSTTWIYPVAYVLLLRHRRCFRAWGFSPSRAYTPVRPSVCLSVCLSRGRKFQGKGVIHLRILASENYSPWAITLRCLRDPTFSRFDTIPACDTHTHRQTHDDSYYPRIACAARVKTPAGTSIY